MPAPDRRLARTGLAGPILQLPGDITVEVTRKDIRTLRLRVHAPDGRVTLSVPLAVPRQVIDDFVFGRLDWILKHRRQIAAREYEPDYRYRDGERHWFAGRRYPLKVVERRAPARVVLGSGELVLQVRPGSDAAHRRALLEAWYRRQLRSSVPDLIDVYAPRLGVAVREFGIRRMRTRWGTCNPRARRIWLNLELAKRPPECLEYVVVHEMVHLLEAHHNTRFYALMDDFLPRWRECTAMLERSPPRP